MPNSVHLLQVVHVSAQSTFHANLLGSIPNPLDISVGNGYAAWLHILITGSWQHDYQKQFDPAG